MPQLYGKYGIPTARVIGRFDRATGYVASDSNVDIPAATLASPMGGSGVSVKNCVYNELAECFHREPVYINRNTYLLGIGAHRQEAPLYRDSDAELEQGRRTFRVIPTFNQAAQGEDFHNPGNTATGAASNGYPADYRGPRWENVTMPVATGSNYAQFIQQTQASYGVRWALQQTKANFRNQPFWIQVKKASAVSPDPSANIQSGADMHIDDPASGSYFAIILGGSGTSLGKMDSQNSYTVVFPIDGPAYAIDNKIWKNQRQLIGTGAINDTTLQQAIQSSIVASSINGSALADNNRDFTVTVMVINNRITVTTSWGDSLVLPAASIDVFTQEYNQSMRTKLAADKYSSSSTGFSIPPLPIELRGRGFQCAVNFNPMEFGLEDGVLNLPPIIVSKDQEIRPYFGGQAGFVANYDTSENLEETPLCIPSGDITLSNGRGFGYDLNPVEPRVTSMGLPSMCLDVVRIGEPMTANQYFGSLGGGATTIDNSNELASWQLVARYSVVLKGDVNVQGQNRDGYSSACSAAYKTPFWTRVLWRVVTIFNNGTDGFNLTPYVKSISFNDSHESRIFLSRTATLTLRMPKEMETNYTDTYGPVSRTALFGGVNGFTFARLSRNACIFKIWVHNGDEESPGWADSDTADGDSSEGYMEQNCYFTGISLGGSTSEGRDDDTITLEIKDMTEVLKRQLILNSPYFDGMSLVYAVAHLLERSGIPALDGAGGGNGSDQFFRVTRRARQAGIMSYRLPDSGRFTNPLCKVGQGSTLDGIRGFCKRFWAVFYVDGQGRYTLDTLEGHSETQVGIFRETNGLEPKATFVTYPGFQGTGKYAMLLERKRMSPDFSQLFNIFSVRTVDRFSGAIITAVDGDLDSIVNPESDNFLGFPSATFTANGAYGGFEEAMKFIATIKNVLSKPITKIDISIIGRSDIRVMDIIRIDNNNYRVLSIQSEITTGPPKWTMNISAEHMGDWEEDIDASAMVFS